MTKTNVTIYLSAELLERCRAAAAADDRTLSNYLSGLLERAHPAQSSANPPRPRRAEPTTARRGSVPSVGYVQPGQIHLEDAIAAAVKRGPVKAAKHK